ncbi:hypothetical protein QCA50_001253 [Cerrena zonata]|uniref:3-keto sterol reductase n=1 Tax=Cerrena zonata TaxID=2478898 RepID=A0AAW0H0K8_9APHY
MLCQRPIIIVTGANSGIGFGICHRLLIQLSTSAPSDASPQFTPIGAGYSSSIESIPSCDSLTIIMACRSKARALEARQKLLDLLDDHVAREIRRPDYDGHAEKFRNNLELDFLPIDMSNIRSVFRFANAIPQKYPYISHLICNAGCGTFNGINWFKAIRQMLSRPVVGVTVTEYKRQFCGRLSDDGLGFVWECNVFSHYILFRHLQPSFISYQKKFSEPARILWMSSLEAAPYAYSRDDWQCLKTDMSYEASKYQIDLIATKLHMRSLEESSDPPIRHLLVHPGIAESNMSKDLVFSIIEYLKLAIFYFVRWCGSPNHTITPFTASVAAVHLCLIPILCIPTRLMSFRHVRHGDDTSTPIYRDGLYTASLYRTGLKSAEATRIAEEQGVPPPLKFGSESDSNGNARVGVVPVLEWADHEKDSVFLVDKCESLYQVFSKLEDNSPKETNGHAGNGQNGHIH